MIMRGLLKGRFLFYFSNCESQKRKNNLDTRKEMTLKPMLHDSKTAKNYTYQN